MGVEKVWVGHYVLQCVYCFSSEKKKLNRIQSVYFIVNKLYILEPIFFKLIHLMRNKFVLCGEIFLKANIACIGCSLM